MKLLVITFDSTLNQSSLQRNAGLVHLENSLHHFGYDYHVLTGEQFSWGGDNYKVIVEWLKEYREDYTHILYTDAWDTLVFGNAAQVEKAYTNIYEPISSSQNYWLFSGEKNPCFANATKENYPSDSRWKYICAGNYIVSIDLFIRIVGENPRLENENDQQWASRIYETSNNGWIMIDTNCELFQTMYNMQGLHKEPNWFEFGINDQYEFVNTITLTKPIFVHGNGKVDMRGIYHHPYKNY